MVKYKLTKSGVQNLSTTQFIENMNSREGRKYQKWLAEGNKPEPMDIIDPWIAKRQERNLILQSCDWTMLSDNKLTTSKKDAWKEYRQKLRDLPQDFKNAKDIVWPNPPA